MVRIINFGMTNQMETEGLIQTWVNNLEDLVRVESENIMEAQRKYLRAPYKDPKKWFLVLELKKMHKMMFGNVWDSAGKYRKTLSVDGSEPQKIAVHIAKLCLEVHSWLDDVLKYSMLQMAAVIHFRLVEIKPFEKGNRRFARLV